MPNSSSCSSVCMTDGSGSVLRCCWMEETCQANHRGWRVTKSPVVVNARIMPVCVQAAVVGFAVALEWVGNCWTLPSSVCP